MHANKHNNKAIQGLPMRVRIPSRYRFSDDSIVIQQIELKPDSLVDPGLEKHGVFEVNGVAAAAELGIITNCADA